MLYVYGDGNIPVGVLNTISNITGGTFDEDSTHIEMSSEESKVMMLSSIQARLNLTSMTHWELFRQKKQLIGTNQNVVLIVNLI